MTFPNALRGALAVALLAAASGCVAYRGPRGVEAALEAQMGVELHREFGLKLGWASTKFTGALVAHDGDDDALAIKDLTGLGVAVFSVPRGAGRRTRLDPDRLHLGGFATVVTVRDRDGQVLLLAKSRRGTIREIVFLACDDDEVVVARLRGDLDRLVERVMQAADDDGVRGARRAVPVAAR